MRKISLALGLDLLVEDHISVDSLRALVRERIEEAVTVHRQVEVEGVHFIATVVNDDEGIRTQFGDPEMPHRRDIIRPLRPDDD